MRLIQIVFCNYYATYWNKFIKLTSFIETSSYSCVLVQVDDTTADLAGGRYYNNESIAAITLGMATNAAYIEPPQEVPKWHGPSPESGEMVSNLIVVLIPSYLIEEIWSNY